MTRNQAAGLSLAFLVGVGAWFSSTDRPAESTDCYAIDGDTLDCDGTRLRLNGIDAPEKGEAGFMLSTLALDNLVAGKPVKWEALKLDRYERVVAQVTVNSTDLSCAQLQNGYADYVYKWDERGLVMATCWQQTGMGEQAT